MTTTRMSELHGPAPENDPSSDSWRPPAVYQWQPTTAPYGAYRAPAPRPAPQAGRRSQTGLLGGLMAALAAFFKYGFLLLKLGKLGPTLISMVVALFF